MSLVEDILDLAKIEAGTFSLNKQLFEVKSLVQDIQYVFEFQCTQKGIYFKVDIDNILVDKTFCSDIGRIKQVLNNLISNACKFTLRGGITLHISLNTEFDTDSFERVRYLKFTVSDTGVGVDEKEIPKLFKLFGMIDQHRNKLNSKGTGLGLEISKKLVESLGGKISLKSKLNIGTDITFTIRENNEEIIQVEEEKKSDQIDQHDYFRFELPYLDFEDHSINQVQISHNNPSFINSSSLKSNLIALKDKSSSINRAD